MRFTPFRRCISLFNARFVITFILLGSQNERYNEIAVYIVWFYCRIPEGALLPCWTLSSIANPCCWFCIFLTTETNKQMNECTNSPSIICMISNRPLPPSRVLAWRIVLRDEADSDGTLFTSGYNFWAQKGHRKSTTLWRRTIQTRWHKNAHSIPA